jgi:hypothetical protein
MDQERSDRDCTGGFSRREKLKILVELEGKMELLQHQEARHDTIPCFNN